MERWQGLMAGQPGPADEAELVLPSRWSALEECRAAAGSGIVLVTGDAGTGKTWLLERLAAWDDRRWVTIDATPATDGEALLHEILRGLGLRTRLARGTELRAILEERSASGERIGLAIDELHLAGPAVLETVRVLSNRLGRDDGFDALVLLGQTPLVSRLRLRALAGLQARLAAHVHLMPLSSEEASRLAEDRHAGCLWEPHELEQIHREVAGNPARLLQRLARLGRQRMLDRPAPPTPSPRRPIAVEPPAPTTASEPAGAPTASFEGDTELELHSSVPMIRTDAPPPIELDEETIEIGWDEDPGRLSDLDATERTDLETTPARDASEVAAFETASEAIGTEFDDEERAAEVVSTSVVIDDHYAALQAWNEWNANQGLDAAGRQNRTHSAHVRAEAPHGGTPGTHLAPSNREARDLEVD
jgi:hypothetical protein